MLKFVVGLVKRIKPEVTAALPILLFATFILLNVAIWWAGPWLDILEYKPLSSIVARAVASSLFTLGSFAIWGAFQWRKLQSFQAEKKHQEKLQNDPIRAYEERQETELNQIMLNMKQSLNKHNALYALPWYLVLGLENAGKTSLINRSGHNFAFSSVMRASGIKSSNPYSFDWWIGDESVIIDPDGELLTQGHNNEEHNSEMERRLWLHFVHWLDRTRSRRPLNGIILALDLSHLATATASERKVYANLLRARLRELMETLSVRLPVYITLTKTDLLYGFEPFFRHYTKSQREEVLGFTFSLDSVNDLDSWLKEFETEYSRFIERINAIFPHTIFDKTTQEDRNAIYSFTRQIAGLKDILLLFCQDVLASDQFSTSALVRGTYFTSVYQQGIPTNAFDNAASRRYSLSHAINSAQQAKNSTIYFTEKLFTQIIYPEAGLASDNARIVKNKRRLLGLSFVCCLVITLLLVGSWHKNYISNVQHADGVLEKVNQYKEQLSNNNIILSQQGVLEPLNKIREATLEFGFFREKPQYISDFGLYQGHRLGPKVEETYLNLLESRFLPLLMADVIIALNQAQSDEEALGVLRVYRMLVDQSGRHQDYVLDYFSKYWQKSFSGKRQIQEDLLGHLEYAMQHTDLTADRLKGGMEAKRVLSPYDEVIANVQTHLSSMPNDQRVYRNLKLSSQTLLGSSINVRSLVGPVFDVVFEERSVNSESLYIPQMFTKRGFEEFFMPQSESVSDLALIDDWVLGQTQTAQFSEADKQVLRDKIRDLYIVDYIKTWREALNEVNVKYFNNINDAVMVLDNITSNLEPMQRLLRTLGANTRIYTTIPQDDAAQKALLKSSKYQVASMIEMPFSDLNGMLTQLDSNPAYISEVLGSVDELKSYLKAIQDAPDVGMAALNATKARMALANVDPIYTLKRISSGLPTPLDSMFSKLADESWYVIKQEAIKYLEVRWSEDVYQPYQSKLAGRYPIDPSAKKDVSLKDFESFFAPDGTLDSFYNNQLKMFIEENIVDASGDSVQSIIREEVLEQIEQAQNIREAFFNRKGILDVTFTVEPLLLSNNKRRSVLNVDGQFLLYSHGPREGVEFIWPNTLRDTTVSKVTLVPITNNMSPRSIQIQGPWAFFRLLDDASVIAASSTSVDYQFTVDGGDMIYRVNSEVDSNPFTERLFKSFTLSKTLY